MCYVILLHRADVACRALGYSHGESYERDGSASGLDIVLDNVRCDGNESNFAECTTKRLGQHDCVHTQDIGIKCCESNATRAMLKIIQIVNCILNQLVFTSLRDSL